VLCRLRSAQRQVRQLNTVQNMRTVLGNKRGGEELNEIAVLAAADRARGTTNCQQHSRSHWQIQGQSWYRPGYFWHNPWPWGSHFSSDEAAADSKADGFARLKWSPLNCNSVRLKGGPDLFCIARAARRHLSSTFAAHMVGGIGRRQLRKRKPEFETAPPRPQTSSIDNVHRLDWC